MPVTTAASLPAALNNPIIYTRAAGGGTVSQLITDFGHTTNLVASARLQAKADEQNAAATKEDVLVATDQAFYSALQTHAVLKVAEQTVASRQLLADQVSALTKSKLKSDLDLSFCQRESCSGQALVPGCAEQRQICRRKPFGDSRVSDA